MQQIVRCEPWTTTPSHEYKNWRRTQHNQFIFKTYHVRIIVCAVALSAGIEAEDSIISGINGMELVLNPSSKASHQSSCPQGLFHERVFSVLIDRCHRLRLMG